MIVPRHRKAAHGEIGAALQRALDERELSPQELAAAARVHKGTLYKILDGRTTQPHLSTMRRLCKVLHLDLKHVLDLEQLELLGARVESAETLTEIEELLVAEINSFPAVERHEAAEHAIFAALEVKLGMGLGADREGYDRLRANSGGSSNWIEALVRQQLRDIPRELRTIAVQAALGALIDLRILRGRSPQSVSPSRMMRVRYRLVVARNKPKRRASNTHPGIGSTDGG